MSRAPWTTVAHAFRRTALPLVCYYAVTLAVPLANGAALSRAFVEHSLVVLVVPPVVIVLACAIHMIAHALARRFNLACFSSALSIPGQTIRRKDGGRES
jgi:hypothetical protein